MALLEGCDYSFSRPDPVKLKAAGKTFAVRYIGTPGSGKNLTKAEAQALQAAGLDVVSNYEAGNAGWMHGGRTVGVAAAKAAHADAISCGMPPTRPIYFSADWNATLDEYKTQIRPCLQGAADVLGGPGRVGVYGSVYVVTWAMEDGVADWGWGTYAWSFGQWPPNGQLRQYKNGVALAGGTVDLCRAVTDDFGQWNSGGDMSAEDVAAVNKHTDEQVQAVQENLNRLAMWAAGKPNAVYNVTSLGTQGRPVSTADTTALATLVQGEGDQTQAAIAALQLGGADPATIAAAVIAGLGPELAGQLAAELAVRLAT